MMTVSAVVSLVAEIFILVLIIRAILSWFTGVTALQPIARFFERMTDPILEPIRRRLPPVGGLDLSPIVAFFLIWLIENVLLFLLAGR